MADEQVKLVKKRKKAQTNGKNPKRSKPSSRKKPGFNEEIYKETEYCIKSGLRYVKPYYFTFTSYCKGRWLQRKLIDVLSQEFQTQTVDYYRTAIKNGNIKVNGQIMAEDVILKDNDLITHKVHRHEPPVTAEPIQIIEETDELVVVNKPSSIPIHPCGRYRHNTLVFLLGREFGMTNLHTIHRIDRLTSGIVIFAKSLKKAQQLERQLREKEMQKEYVCKVQGEFPSETIDCTQPISVVSHKVGVCRVHPGGKPCRTVFTREHYDGVNSVVKCQPHTGRMHQIRVHLQWLGHPIVDDPIYNNPAWGSNRGSGGVDDDKAWKVIESIATSLRHNDVNHDVKSANRPGELDLEPLGNVGDGAKNCETIPEMLSNNVATMQEEQCIPCLGVNAGDPVIEDLESSARTGSKHQKNDEKDVPSCGVNSDMVDGLKKKTEGNEADSVGKIECENNGEIQEVNASEQHTRSSLDVEVNTEEPKCSGKDANDEWEKVPGCTECGIRRADPTPAERSMCLHAAVYKGPGWEFKCPWPSWALPQTNTI